MCLPSAGLIVGGDQDRARGLADAAAATAALASHAASDSIGTFMHALVELAETFDDSPPIAVVDRSGQPLSELLHGADPAHWERHPLEDHPASVWLPQWASTLLPDRLLAGIVLNHPTGEPEPDLFATLDYFEQWQVPLLVTGSVSGEMARALVAFGATSVPDV